MAATSDTPEVRAGAKPKDLSYGHLLSQGLDPKQLVVELLRLEGTNGVHLLAKALHEATIPADRFTSIETISALEDLKASACELQAGTTYALEENLTQQRVACSQRSVEQEFGVGPEVAIARHKRPRSGISYVNFTKILFEDLPHTRLAFRNGTFSEEEAMTIVKEVKGLNQEQRQEIDCRVYLEAPSVVLQGGKKLASIIRAWALSYGSAKDEDSHEKANDRRFLNVVPVNQYESRIVGSLPTGLAVLVAQAITARISQAQKDGDSRPHSQVAADAFVEGITGVSDPSQVPVTLGIVMTDRTLIQGHAEPAHLEGYGVISAEHARKILCGTQAHPNEYDVWVRRLYTAPGTADLIAMDSAQRKFTGNLRKFIIIRDQFCRTPFCDSPIRHLDHVLQAAKDGPTSVENSDGLCAFCNLTKEAPGWKEETVPGPRHTKRVTTSSGQTYLATALPLPGATTYNVEPAKQKTITEPKRSN
ncbi:hypothetical protein CQ018_16130 [Arthrobacter sp. MYb227]|uniref:DUF222 domain-containing protein n=1 Tax=Arthrobacter sp. MYb227 TaxID=1848601 RepID=UPI000CFD4AF3|nr:DUF222 domain-containing protein [Arthrobacter sp. MYb227]PQZ89072.1 hypothetical protein CQ018_16130 [Arthrobacter sp. MYb227]